MRMMIAAFTIVMLGLIAAAADEAASAQATPAEQYQALLKEYQTASSSGTVLTDEERMKFVGRVYKLRNKLALKFVELAEKYPDDPVALDALIQAVWQVNGTPWPVELVGTDDAPAKALALLERDHVQSEQLGSVCQRIAFGFREEYEPFLRAVLKKNPHREVQAQACLGLAHFLNNRLQRLELIKEQPERGREFEGLFGKDYFQRLQKQNGDKTSKEAEELLERAARDFADVKLPDGGTVGDKAAAELFEIRHLIVGKRAPDIEGEDQEGKKFRLSDYRGNVVLLDFWQEY